MKSKIIGLVLGVLILVPAAVFAIGPMPESNDKGIKESENIHHRKSPQMMDKNWHEKMKQKEQKLLGLVIIYTPEKKQEWVKVLKERNNIREKWLSPEFAKKRAQWKKEKMSKIDILQKQYEEGEISKEEFMKKVHGNKAIGNWNTYHELKVAVKNNNKKKAASLLNRLLVQYKRQNELMIAAMNNL